MVEEFKTLKNETPIISPAGVPSLVGSGSEAIANDFSQIGNDVLSISKQRRLIEYRNEKLQETASTYQALTAAGKLKTAAEIDILNNPSRAYETAKSFSDNINNIAKITNVQDRNKLELNLSHISNALLVSGSRVQQKDNLLKLKVDFDNSLPQSLSTMTQAFESGNLELFSTTRSNLLQLSQELYSSSAISRKEYENLHKTINDFDDSISQLSNLKHNDETSHIIAANPLLDIGVPHQIGRSEAANKTSDILHNTSTLNQLASDLASGKQLNIASFINLNKDKRDLLVEYAKGASTVNGKLSFGTDFQELNERHDYLLSLKNPTPKEQGEQQRLGNVLNSLNVGEFNSVIGQIPAGKQIQAEYNAEASLGNDTSFEQAVQIRSKARDNYITKAANLWLSQNGDPSFIRVGADSVAKLESAITNPNVSPTEALNEISRYSQHNRIYLANSLKDPLHQTATFMASNLMGRVPSSDISELISSIKNYKTNIDAYKAVNKSERKDINAAITGFLGANKDTLDYLNTVGATDIRNNIIKLQNQYVLHKTLQNNGKISGGNEFNQLLDRAFNITNGKGYTFSLSAMPGITPSQAELIANKTLAEAYEKIGLKYSQPTSQNTVQLLTSGEGTPLNTIVNTALLAGNLASRISNIFTRSNVPIKVFNELNGTIKAIDRNGQVIIQHHLTDDYIRSVLTD